MVAGMNNCFPCFTCQKSKKSNSKNEPDAAPLENVITKAPDMKKQRPDEANKGDAANVNAKHFTFRELATATKNFRQECLLSEGGFGRVYKGIIPATGQAVAVKQLDRHGMNGSKEFLAAINMLTLLHHENLVNLIGYCADGDQRLLVYEYVPGILLDDRLLEKKVDQPPLDWYTRMKVAAGAASGLEHLHDNANPPFIYRDLKASKILLDNDYNAKLIDFGLAQLSGGDAMNAAPPRVMGTYGYCAPEYVRTGQLTLKSDVYSFGVVLLELITGRRAIDTTRPNEEQNLVSWAQPIFRDPKKYPDMADPLLGKNFPEKDLNQAVAIAAMCLQEEAEARPLMSDVVTALSFLSMVPPVTPVSLPPSTSVSKESAAGESESESGSGSESESESQRGSDGEASDHEDNNDTAQDLGAPSAKFQDCKSHREFESKPSRKSSTRSKKETSSSPGSEGGSVSSSNKSSGKSRGVIGNLSKKISRKSTVKELSQKSSKKSSVKEMSQKSSRKFSIRGLSYKSSRKSSVRVLSHKSSMESEDGNVSFEHCDSMASHANTNSSSRSSMASEDGGALFGIRGSSKLSQGNISFGLTSTSDHSDHNSSRRTDEGSINLERASSMGSEMGSCQSFVRASSTGSNEGSVHS